MEFLLLGPLEVRSEGRVVALGGRRQRALLALLLLRANEVVSVDALAEGLWGENPPAKPGRSLQVFVSSLRKALREAGGEAERIVTQSPGYRVEVAPGELDLERFERLAAEGRAALARGEATVAADRLRAALALWRGEPLADFAFEPFAQASVARLEELRLSVLEDRLAADLQLGTHAELVGELEELVAHHPYREQLRAHLMLALYRAGRQSEALAVYQATRTLLVEELGIDPKPELQALERAILVHDPALEPPVPAQEPAPTDVMRLPTPPTPLVGRERELDELQELVLAQRLVTVTGPGGMGKTRIALAACARLQGAFAEGVRFVQLAALTDPALVPATLALALALEERPGEELSDTIARALSESEVLLCLDNMEQLLEAAPFLAELLSRCPRLRLLVTSRSVLRLAGEHEYPLPPLADDDAAQLFADRARAASPGFALQEHERTVIAICERLDRLPLALELAAARVKLLPPPALLERLERSLELLTGGARDLPARQQTLRAAIDWSYQLLNPDEQRAFRALSVFSGGFTFDAAAVVTDQDELRLLDSLTALVEHNLVHRVSDGERPRFSFLHVLREYAGERLEASGEAEHLRRAHATWCIALALESERNLDTGADQSQTLRALEYEHENFRAALTWSIEREERALAVRLVALLGWFWFLRGHLAEAHDWLARVLAWRAVEPADRELLVARAGNIAFRRGDLATARGYYGEALELRRHLGRHDDVPAMLSNLGSVATFEGDYERATALLEESVELARVVGDEIGIAAGLCNLAEVVLFTGDPGRARELAEEATERARELDHPWGLSVSLAALAGALLDLGEPDAAVAPLGESVLLTVELGDVAGLADRLELLAETTVARGRAERCAELLGAAETLREAIGAPRTTEDDHRIARCLAQARVSLGEADLERLIAGGRGLSRAEAVATALDEAAGEAAAGRH